MKLISGFNKKLLLALTFMLLFNIILHIVNLRRGFVDREKLQRYIEENIPIVKDMGFVVEDIEDERIVVSGEYCRHINHTKSVFGGSISSVMTLAGWGRVRILIEEFDPLATVVIKSNSTEFIRPVTEDYLVYTGPIDGKRIDKFRKTYEKFGRGRIEVEAFLTHRGSHEVLARFKGEFVALKKS